MSLWKEIAGYEGLYLVSDLGEIVALPRKVVASNGKEYCRRAKPMKKQTRGRGNLLYESVYLTKDKERENYSVHRLVAEAFLPNPDGLPEVNHKDEDPLNNAVENLEWCTRQYNIEYSKAKAVEQIKDGDVIARFGSIVKASHATGIGRRSIDNVLNGWSKHAGGYEWRYCAE